MAYDVVEKQVIFSGNRVRLEVHTVENDQTGTRHAREVVVHPGAVVILPVLPDGRFLLIRNHRYTIGEWLIELPAGTLEPKEDPMNCAGRELVEETGYLAGRLVRLGNFFTSPGVLSEKIFAFVAYDLEPAQTKPDEGEQIELMPVSADEAIGMIRQGIIHDAKTIAAILMYDRFVK